MKEKERMIVGGLVVLMLLIWLGFPLHHSPRFAGSFWGGMLGVAGALLMLVPLAYLVVKRARKLKKKITRWVSMKTLLAWHIYAGILGPILVVLHSGHKYESVLGITVTAMTLLVVISGFIGRYLMNLISKEIREKKTMLQTMNEAYDKAARDLGTAPERAALLRPFSGFFSRIIAGFFVHESARKPALPTPQQSDSAQLTNPVMLLQLSDAIADVEYSIKTHEQVKIWFAKWLKFHIVISVILYLLMALHIWGAVHFGIRWFDASRATTSHYSRTTPTYDAAVDAFSRHFGQLFERYWSTPLTIHGIRTTAFDYAGIAKETAVADSHFSNTISALSLIDPEHLSGDDREKAFWINVYNFGAMKLAAENYPVKSITDPKIGDDPWSIPNIRVGTRAFALREIEKEILLGKFDDPRIVFAVSCAAVSCPDRSREIFSSARIDEQLDMLVRELLSNPTKGMKIDKKSKIVTLSWIFKADRRLFGDGSDAGILSFVRSYATAEQRVWIDENFDEISIAYFEHDWGLNDVALAEDARP